MNKAKKETALLLYFPHYKSETNTKVCRVPRVLTKKGSSSYTSMLYFLLLTFSLFLSLSLSLYRSPFNCLMTDSKDY